MVRLVYMLGHDGLTQRACRLDPGRQREILREVQGTVIRHLNSAVTAGQLHRVPASVGLRRDITRKCSTTQ